MTVRQAAAMLGVGVSSLKRWADGGLVTCEKTPGGHRRFRRSSVEALLRARSANGAPAEPDGVSLVGLLLGTAPSSSLDAHLSLEKGRLGTWWRVADEVARSVHEIGELWARGEITVLQEHVSTERLSRALARVCETLPYRADAPHALLVTAEGDEHTLGLSLAEVVLREAGWNVWWGGRQSPVAEVRSFVERRRLDLIAVSASRVSGDAAHLYRQVESLARACRLVGAELILGGQGLWPEPPPFGVRLHDFQQLASELVRMEKR